MFHKTISKMLQYIVCGNNAPEIISTATCAIDNGCRWIRLDLREMTQSEVETVVNSLKEKCAQFEAFLSLEDYVETTATMKIAGVHLGIDSDTNAVAARKKLGEEPIIGITVAEASEIPFIPRTAIDYIAVASDDLDVCRKVVEQMHATGFEEPVIAPYSHATPLSHIMATGINGIAVHHTTTQPSMLKELIKELNTLVEQRLNDL